MFKYDQITVEPKPIDPIELARQEKDKNFRIYSKADILAILRDIMQRNTLVTVYFDQGNNFILTSILAVDSEKDEMVIDYGIDEKLNQKALSSKRITFVTSQNRIKIEFACGSNTHTKKEFFSSRHSDHQSIEMCNSTSYRL